MGEGGRGRRRVPSAITVCEYLYPAILVDKVDSAVSERLQFSLDEGVASQEDDWKSNAAFSKATEQLETGHLRQAPVEQGNSRLDSIVQCVEKRRSIRKSRDRNPRSARSAVKASR